MIGDIYDGIVAGTSMAVKPPASELHKPACPYCGDTRIALLKEPQGRDWWLSCYACGQTWQVTKSGSIAEAPTGR